MKEPTLSTIKRLFAKSGNHCAFPNCPLPIVEEQGTTTGTVCHIKARSKGGPRYDPKQTSEERRSFGNLILMCARHGKLIDSDPKTYTIEVLQSMKAEQERKGFFDLSTTEEAMARSLFKEFRSLHIHAGGHVMVGSPGAVQGTTVNIKTTKSKIKVMPAEGTIASDALRRNYVKYLIDRYNDFAGKQLRKKEFTYAAIYTYIKKQFRADWERILLIQFDALVSLLHTRIDKTQLGRINCGKGIGNYLSFDDYRDRCTS